jgi:Asp-tRNA(Asn)/Glu-tRNA(Gln) amidotransferase A subunit family amidase
MSSSVAVRTRSRTTVRLNRLTATEIVEAVASGETNCESVMHACFERIDARENAIHAWASFDRELALNQARALDAAGAPGRDRLLYGVPIGVKDIIDTADLPTEMGSPIYRGNRPTSDAACVALVRAAGALILGKTVTCEFAGMTPGPTANPHNTGHTPGGSSSGSGAAVADCMVPVAFGTQTGGSVLRPASYCGVFGFKPSFGAFNRRGVFPAAESLDTIGLIARSLDDLELVTTVLELRTPSSARALDRPPCIGLCRTPMWNMAQPETVAGVEAAARALEKAGAEIRDLTLPDEFAGLRHAARETINNYERAAAMTYEWSAHRDRISDRLRKRIETGRAMPRAEYLAGLKLGEDCRTRLPAVFEEFDVLLTPCVNGEPPRGLGETGDPGFQAIWTILHVPSLSLPTHRGPNGLPVGIQLVAQRQQEARLFACAHWIWERLGAPEMVGVSA